MTNCTIENLTSHPSFTKTDYGRVQFLWGEEGYIVLVPATAGWYIAATDTHIPLACTPAEVYAICEALVQWYDKFDVLCTYCWQRHMVEIDTWLENRRLDCGPDPARYFFNHDDYISYVRWYEANGCQHSQPEPDVQQMRLF